MPSINPNLVPTINPGDIFNRFVSDSSLNVRWLTAGDPCQYEVLNRPTVDVALRQLIIAKALDSISLALGYLAMFPFVIQPQVQSGSTIANIPIRIFWDFHASVSNRWTNVRLARIDRVSGSNGSSGSDDFTGVLRFIFSANPYTDGITATSEVAVFYADYTIDSSLTYQRTRVGKANDGNVPDIETITASEAVTIDGDITFNTLDLTDTTAQAFFDLLAPALTGVAEYWIIDSAGSLSSPDFDASPISHGTGMLADSACNLITPMNADPDTWLEAFNYPFGLDCNRTANDSSGVVIPLGLFSEFNIVAPASDQPSDDTSGAYFPVWISRITRQDTAQTLTLYFSTYGINPVDASNPIEFATMQLSSNMAAGQIVTITPLNTLFPLFDTAGWQQEFGRGHVSLSSLWGVTGGDVTNFFSNFPTLVSAIATVTFGLTATRISSWGVSRVPKYTPTADQSAAMVGTAADRDTPLYPGSSNKFVVEKDEGLGDPVDLEAVSGITPSDAIDRYGYTATSIHKAVKLVVDPDKASATSDPNFYTEQILPRLRLLFGRDPVFGDQWYNGNRFMTYNGDSWISG